MRTFKNSFIAAVIVILLQFILLAISFAWLQPAHISDQVDRVVPGAGSMLTSAIDHIAPNTSVIYARAIISPDIQANLVLSSNARDILAVGGVGCTQGETFIIEARITQRATGAMSSGKTHGQCTGELQTWQAKTNASGPARFERGEALACGLIRTRLDDEFTDAWQWCDKVMLVSP